MKVESGENQNLRQRLSRWAKGLIPKTSSNQNNPSRPETTFKSIFASEVSTAPAHDQPAFSAEPGALRRGAAGIDALGRARNDLKEMGDVIDDLNQRISSLEKIAEKWRERSTEFDRRA